MPDCVIEADALTKSFKGHDALRGFDLRVPAGSIFGFLGRNGAGKTTAIKLMMGLLRADGGGMRVLGEPISSAGPSVEIRRRIGFVTEDKELYPYMTVGQIIRFTRAFFPSWRADLERKYLEVFDLPRDRKIPKLSKGMRSKLMLLLAISRGAELLILDEPMEGLDPAAAEETLSTLASLAADGMTIFFSSHQIADVEQVADHVCIIDRGRAIVAGALDDLKLSYQRLHVVFEQHAPEHVVWGDGVEQVRREGRVLSILASRNVDAIFEQARAFPGASVERFPVTLKEIFLEHVRSR
jgi:ABC-2 type transport system ATP-binding protein